MLDMWISGVFDSPKYITYDRQLAVRQRAYRLLFRNGQRTSRAPKRFELQVKKSRNIVRRRETTDCVMRW